MSKMFLNLHPDLTLDQKKVKIFYAALINYCKAANVECNKEFIENLMKRLFWLSSKKMQLHIARCQGQRSAPNALDIVFASIDRQAELGINRSAYNAASKQMGDLQTALCILIIDSERFHPDTPIQNPGGVLRAMTARDKAGKLNLIGSLIEQCKRKKG